MGGMISRPCAGQSNSGAEALSVSILFLRAGMPEGIKALRGKCGGKIFRILDCNLIPKRNKAFNEGMNVASLPKLKVKKSLEPGVEKIYEFRQAQDILFNSSTPGVIIAVEKRLVHSYEQLVQLASEAPYKDREYLEVTIFPYIPAGG
jgi:hypothetical protein